MDTQYTDRVIEGMQALYGEGFLSPGGPDEMPVFLEGVDLAGRDVLDLGSGLGGASVMLADMFGAGHVTGIDVAADLVERAGAYARSKGLDGRVEFRAVDPGPLPFADRTFDAVFTKDVICHVADKHALFAEIARVLGPGGRLLCADFVTGREDGAPGQAFDAWVDAMQAYGLSFRFERLGSYTSACEAAGLVNLTVRDHTGLSSEACRREVAFVTGGDAGPLREALGEEKFAARIEASRRRLEAFRSGGLRHVHILAERGS